MPRVLAIEISTFMSGKRSFIGRDSSAGSGPPPTNRDTPRSFQSSRHLDALPPPRFGGLDLEHQAQHQGAAHRLAHGGWIEAAALDLVRLSVLVDRPEEFSGREGPS